RMCDVVRSGRLTKKLRQVAVARTAIKVVAQIATDLAARIRNTRRPIPGTRVQHDVRGLEARCGKDNDLGVNLDLLLALAVHIRHALSLPAFIHQYAPDK